MYMCVSSERKLMNEYRQLPPSGPRKLTPEMQSSLDAADKPTKRGKKPERKEEKEGQSSKKRKTKKKAHKPKAPSLSDYDCVPSDQQPEPDSSDDDVSQHKSSLRGNSPPPSPVHEGNQTSPPPSPTQLVPITIAPCPPPISSSTTTSIPIPTPLFTEVTTTTTTTTEPQVRVNISDIGEPTSESEPPITLKPLSSPPSHESDIVLGGAEMEFDSIYFSPYRVQSDDDDDDDAPVIKRQLKNLNDKLDQLLSSSSSNASEAYSEAAIKALLATFVKEHDTSISNVVKATDASTSSCQKASIAVEESTKDCKQATAKVEKLISYAHVFLDSLQAAAQKNAQMVNASVDNLTSSLQTEKKHFEEARQVMETNYTKLQSSIHTHLDKLQANLAMENKVIDELALKTTKVKTQVLKLTQALKENDELNSEGEDVSHGQPQQPPTSKPISQPKVTAEPKGNEALDSMKDKRKKKVGDANKVEIEDVVETVEETSKTEDLKIKRNERELEEKLHKANEEAERERKQKEANDALERRKSMFPLWMMEKLLKELIESPSTH
ncbi:uncharacterized protein LOC111909654 [Lactuca sativa]|uniref:uncharacterized protein LOC111909654 n=1 Tax=Lactuca sativa TaxID=4236 RepID=UPI000CD92720|nr:uncharacterized protein LOC111909654 [Lactuca sativa]